MTKEEHVERIVEKLEEWFRHEDRVSPRDDVVVSELAAVWAALDELDPIAAIGRRASRVRAGQSEGKPADEVFERLGEREGRALWREFGIESDANVTDIVVRLNAAAVRLMEEKRTLRADRDRLADRLTRIHRAVTEEGAIEKIMLILAEPEP